MDCGKSFSGHSLLGGGGGGFLLPTSSLAATLATRSFEHEQQLRTMKRLNSPVQSVAPMAPARGRKKKVPRASSVGIATAAIFSKRGFRQPCCGGVASRGGKKKKRER